ncbi:MAG TPA: type II toxin-antitoxin system death-on-curing family toxin [Gammaproteobacteria bacterium]|nr:type II toxin-antitoxin system death-on-curing family toxin [Gammaproteobacteria bacterium]
MPRHIKWVPEQAIHAIHLELIADFGGAAGVRDEALLAMSLERPRNKYAYGERNLCELAAAYGFGFARNHPFIDGNKRTAFAVMDVFLRLNGRALAASEKEAYATMIQLAAGDLQETQLAKWLTDHTETL